jgi:predicted ATP-dependent serine protease
MKLGLQSTSFVRVKDIEIPDIYNRRLKCDYDVIDKMFGGGMLPGSVITLSSRAGLGKTTFVLQILERLADKGFDVGFCSSEESVYQVAFNCRRIGVKSVGICNESKMEKILEFMEHMDVVVVDSFQGIDIKDKSDKAVIETFIQKAKTTECVLILICHLTKSGDMRGTNLLTYAVDVNVNLDLIKDSVDGARNIRTTKNRFGPGGDFDCTLTEYGFDFVNIITDKDERVSKKEGQRRTILTMDGKITISTVSKQLDIDATRAGYLLRELATEGKLKQRGRGKKATWKLTSEPKQVVEVFKLPAYI